MKQFLATINTPGYLPDNDGQLLDTAREAWDCLLDQRRDAEDDAIEYGDQSDGYSVTVNILESLSQGTDVLGLTGVDTSSDLTGSVHGLTPGYDGNHDLGLVYSVTEVTE